MKFVGISLSVSKCSKSRLLLRSCFDSSHNDLLRIFIHDFFSFFSIKRNFKMCQKIIWLKAGFDRCL